MDTDDVIKILENFKPATIGAQQAAREALDSEGYDWDEEAENQDHAYYYDAVGERIVNFIKEDAGKLADNHTSLPGLLFGTLISRIDRSKLGQYFYDEVTSD